MPRHATVAPREDEDMEELRLPAEKSELREEENNDIIFFNDSSEVTVPQDDSSVTCSDLASLSGASLGVESQGSFNDVQVFDLQDNFELPQPPNVINIAKPSDDQPAILWFDYKSNLERTPVLSWEVKRYKLNKDGRWSFKSSNVFTEKDVDRKKKSRKFRIQDILCDIQYRFTVTANNVCGKGKESKSSNILYVEEVLPNGWFRTKQSSKVKEHVTITNSPKSSSGSLMKASANHRLTISEASNPILNMSSYSFIYYNLHTGQATVNRPETDPYFIENLDVVKLFNEKEMKHLKAIYDEEMLHFDKVGQERMKYILLEVGERIHPNKIKNVFSEIGETEHFISTFPEFMDVMYTFKMRALSLSSIAAAASSLFSFFGSAVVTYGHIATVGEWNIFLSKVLNRKQFIHRHNKKKTCNMPMEVRLSLSEDDAVYIKATELFNPFEVEIIKLSFLHMDCNNSGSIDIVEIYRYLLVSCGDSLALKNKILSPVMLTQRKQVFAIATANNKSQTLNFKGFINFLLIIKEKDKSFRSKYKALLSAMSSLAEFKVTRSNFVKNLDKYLLAKKQGVYERGKELLEKVVIEEDVVKPDPEEEEKMRKRNPFAGKRLEREKEAQQQYEESDDGVEKKLKHTTCCFCGCRETS